MVARTARDALRACEQRLQDAAADGVPDVADSAIDTLAAGGKRLRPLLVLCCAGQVSDPDDAVLRAAAAVELVHMATLVHDDLLDGATLRRGRATVSSSRGADAAVQVGDFLFAQAFAQLAAAGHPDAVRTLSATALDLSLGELAQGRAAHDLLLREMDYTDRVRRKTASLFAAACRIGGMLGGADAEGQERLAEFGDAVGMAFQIFDDILDYTGDPAVTGKRRGADLRDGTVTLPVILALRDEPTLAGAIRAADGDAGIEALCDRLAAHPATQEARRRALEHVARAREAVVAPVGNADTHALQAIADGVVDRYS
ncbi:MAG: polyprenyl synthetase family protein [Thermoleophilia bacterium]